MLAPGAAQQPAFATLLARLHETVSQLYQVYKADLEAARLEIAQLRSILANESHDGGDETKSDPSRSINTYGALSRSTGDDGVHSRFELFVLSEDFMVSETSNLPAARVQHMSPALSYTSLDDEANGEVPSDVFSREGDEALVSLASGEAKGEVASERLNRAGSRESEYSSVMTGQSTGTVATQYLHERHISFSNLDTQSEDSEKVAPNTIRTSKISRETNDANEGSVRTVSFSNSVTSQNMGPLKTSDPSKVFFSMRSPWIDQQPTGSRKLTVMVEAGKESFANLGSRLDLRNSRQSTSEKRLSASACWCVLHPESKIRGYWTLTCVGFLLYDIAMVPPEVCFDLEETIVSLVMDRSGLAFWTADIALSFFTGVQLLQHVEMRPSRIAWIYIKSWFVFDVAIIIPEWVGTMLDDDSVGSQASVFRVFRYGRFVRLLRMARIFKLGKLWPLIRRLAYTLSLSKAFVQLTQAWVTQSVLLLVFIHVLSCAWYGIGDALDDGWVQTNGLKSASAGRSYLISVQWTLSRLHGMSSGRNMEAPFEVLLDAFLIFISLGIMAYYFGTVSVVATRNGNLIAHNLWKLASLYKKRHGISVLLNLKVVKFLESSSRYDGAGEQAAEDQILLDALPKHLQNELLFESRVRFFLVLPIFEDMYSYSPRILYQLCTLGVTGRLLSDGEIVFAHDDICQGMFFVVGGTAKYIPRATAVEMEELLTQSVASKEVGLFTKPTTESLFKPFVRVQERTAVSEAVLWTRWTHAGSLMSIEDCTVLYLPASVLAKVTGEHRLSFSHACLYAKHFVWSLNHTPNVDDLTVFPELYISKLDNEVFHGKEHDHFIFISHYKVEAGTEASLMRGDWETILTHNFLNHPANDLRSPIFIDSEDLLDLGDLKEHVIHTNTLVLLLTPGVLSRPWCLVEIVTAIQHNLNIVPVEIQRPGSPFSYPTEQFYEDLQGGRYLSQESLDLLDKEGITLDDVENAIRQVFLKIALPFSPHKSKAVREAELQDIFKRCDKEWRSGYFNKHKRRVVEKQKTMETQAAAGLSMSLSSPSPSFNTSRTFR